MHFKNRILFFLLILSIPQIISCKVAEIPSRSDDCFLEAGQASWYGKHFDGTQTASGEIYDMESLTAAHKTLPFDTKVKVVNVENGKSVTVRINNRGPNVEGRIIDLSRRAAQKLDIIDAGLAEVKLYLVDPGDEPVECGKEE